MLKGTYKRTKEFKKKMSLQRLGEKHWNYGKHSTQETRKKMSLAHTGKLKSEECKRKLSKVNKDKILSKKTKEKISLARKGKHHTEETKRKMGLSHKGEKSWNWKGGITPERIKIWHSIEYRLWREAVFARDNWTCQKCKIQGGKLHSHHIRNFAECPELRTSIGNGITFCKKCHTKFHKIYGFRNNNQKQLYEFTNTNK